MKLKQTFFLLAASAISQLSCVSVHAKESSIKIQDRDTTNDGRERSKTLHSPLPNMVKEHPIPSEETDALTPVVVPSASSSSSLLRRELKKEVAENFKQCFETCDEGSVIAPTPDDSCCAGGVSFLKMVFHAEVQISGTIALGSAESCGSSQAHKHTKAGGFLKAPSSSSSSSNAELRLVDCNDICVQKPFGGHPCNVDAVMNEKEVVAGSEICIAMVRSTEKEYEYEIAFDQKMEHNLHVLFLNSEGFSLGVIHTSCSKPLSLSWGVLFGDCENSGSGSGKSTHEHINVTNIVGNGTPYLSFIDGISTEYFITADDALRSPSASSYVKDFDIGFNNCGCTCERIDDVDTPAPYVAPSRDPTSSPTSKPSSNPSPSPTESSTYTATSSTTFSSTPSDSSIVNPGPGSPPASTCTSACSDFILQHCMFVGTNVPCDVNFQVPIIADDDLAEGAAVSTLPPSAVLANAGYYGKGKSSKGKGSKGYGKGSKGSGKWGYYGKVGEHDNKKEGDSTSQYSKLVKLNKGKGGKGRRLFDSEYHRHLQKIEYHQSRLDYFETLLMKLEA